jgi:hypothetical protein
MVAAGLPEADQQWNSTSCVGVLLKFFLSVLVFICKQIDIQD